MAFPSKRGEYHYRGTGGPVRADQVTRQRADEWPGGLCTVSAIRIHYSSSVCWRF